MSHRNTSLLQLGSLGKVRSPDYVRREPEKSVLYRIVAENLNTFLQLTEIEGKRLPKHVTDEFDAFVKCGVLAHGFLRLKCESCSHERIVAFSCYPQLETIES